MKSGTETRRRRARSSAKHDYDDGHPSPWFWAGLGQASTYALLVILLAIFLTGLTMVDVTQQHRRMSRELQELREQVYLQEEERGRLLLEISTFGLADRIERVAREDLRMRMPEPEEIVVVHNGL